MGLFKDLVKSNKSLTDKLLDEVSDIDIYCGLTGIDFDIGKAVHSPLRDDDDFPSFSLFIPTKIKNPRPEEVWWRDFAGGSGNVFSFVQKFAKFQYGIELSSRKDIIKFIDNEMELGIFDKEKKRKYEKRVIDYEKAKKSKELLFTSRPFTRMDKLWWLRYGVDEDLLKEHDVRSIKYLLAEDYTIYKTFGAYDLAFAYVIQDKVKIYEPNSIYHKWRNNCPAHYIMGEGQMYRDDVLVITKSFKDLLVFKSFMYCDAIAPQNEGVTFDEDKFNEYMNRYDYVFVVFDYDPAGIEASKRLEERGATIRWVSKKQYIVNGKTKVKDKDISDYTRNNGLAAGLKRVKELFPELPIEQFREERLDYLLKLQEELAE